MIRPSASAATAPTRLARRLILGTAFLVGLAFALAPHTRVAGAQESKATEAKPAAPAASKTLTITDGRSGGSAKIEITESTPPGAPVGPGPRQPAATEDPPSEYPGNAATGRKGIGVGKHGRVRIEALSSDREFDSFGEFVRDEPAIAGMVVLVVAVVFLAPVLAIGLILWYRFRKARMLNETILTLAEKGVVTPADAVAALAGGKQAAALSAAMATTPVYEQAKQIRRRAAWSDLRKGVIVGGVGFALTLYSAFHSRSPNAIGLVLLFVGVGFVVLWWLEDRQLAPGNGGAAGGAGSGPASGGTPGGAPPSA